MGKDVAPVTVREGGRRIFRALRPDQPPAASSQSTPTYTAMYARKSFSKPFKKLKHRFTEGSRKQDGRSGRDDDREGRETDVGGNEAGQRNSRLRSEVEDVVGSRPGREENSNDVEGKRIDQVDSATSPPSTSHGMESGSAHTARYFNFRF